MEERRLGTRTELRGYLYFPYAVQVLVIQRTSLDLTTGKGHREIVQGVTRLGPEKARPARLLALHRNQGCLENGLPQGRDFTFDEDRGRLRQHARARVRAALRNRAISLWRLAGVVNLAQGLRTCARNPPRPLGILGLAGAQAIRATPRPEDLSGALRPYPRPCSSAWSTTKPGRSCSGNSAAGPAINTGAFPRRCTKPCWARPPKAASSIRRSGEGSPSVAGPLPRPRGRNSRPRTDPRSKPRARPRRV